MLIKASAMAFALIVLGSACSCPARAASGPPTVNIKRTCQENVNALGTSSLGGEIGQDLDVCLEDEQNARQAIIQNWAKYPATAKARCIQTKEYLPGYVEWQACLDMTTDALNLRKQPAAGTANSSKTSAAESTTPGAAGSSARGAAESPAASPTRSTATRRSSRRTSAVQAPASRECPVVKYAEDGSIDYIINCRGPGMPGL